MVHYTTRHKSDATIYCATIRIVGRPTIARAFASENERAAWVAEMLKAAAERK